MDNLFTTEKVYTVLELNDTVKGLIRSEFPNFIWVCGEIQDLRERAHINLNLVQKHPELDQMVAQVKAVIFANVKPRIIKRIKEADSGLELKKDIEVKLLCRVDLYSKTGQFSLTVFDIDPVYTLGKIAQNRIKIIEDLRKRGLLDKNKLKELPTVPLKLGLITAYGSDAYHDFINELNISGYGFKVTVCDCYVQGRFVERDVVRALKHFDKQDRDKFDAIVIIRGGGSTADLSFFDNKKIAEAIARSEFPVLTALGHHINITVADMAAHTFVKTPTAAAKLLVEKTGEFLSDLDYLWERISVKTENILSENKRGLENLAVGMHNFITKYFQAHKEELQSIKHHIWHFIKVFLSKQEADIGKSLEILKFHSQRVLNHSRKYIEYVEGKADLLDPKKVLARGYSITLKGTRAVKSVKDVWEGDQIKTVFYDGDVSSEVKSKREDKEK
jgi:exodeoxyribonuclease VII large subunit